jgi:hypothetical protein
MKTEHASTPTNQQRDERGRFNQGNQGGPGHPFARQVARLRRALLQSVTEEDIQEVGRRLVALAKEGNVQAAKLLLSYTIGKPQPAPEPDRLDADEWQIYRDTTPMKTESAAVIDAGAPEFHLNVVRAMRPVIAQLMQQQIEEIVNETPEQREEREQREAEEAERFLSSPAPAPIEPIGLEEAPSANGMHGAAPPSANGKKRHSAGRTGRRPPSTNGDGAVDRRSPAPA